MSATRINVSLAQYDIGLSGAVSDRAGWSEEAMDRAILEFVALFSGIVFKYGGRIVHGSHPTFTPVILRQARLHAGKRDRKPVTLIMSELWAKDLPAEFSEGVSDVAEFIVTKQVGEGGFEDVDTRNRSLCEMRKQLIERQNVMVAVGGMMHSGDGGVIPGVLEEMEMAAKKKIPRFLIAGMGGYSSEYAKGLTPSSLLNGLSDKDNELLFSTKDVSACINLIFECLCFRKLIKPLNNLRKATKIATKIERLQGKLYDLLGDTLELSQDTVVMMNQLLGIVRISNRRGRPLASKRKQASDGTEVPSKLAERPRPASPSGPLAPAVVKVLERYGRAMKVNEILIGLEHDNYIWTAKNPRQTLYVRIGKLAGVKRAGEGLYIAENLESAPIGIAPETITPSCGEPDQTFQSEET